MSAAHAGVAAAFSRDRRDSARRLRSRAAPRRRAGASPRPIAIPSELIAAVRFRAGSVLPVERHRHSRFRRCAIAPRGHPPAVRTFPAPHTAELARHARCRAIDDRGLRALIDYDWPGNVRQLKNVAERLIVRGPRPIDHGRRICRRKLPGRAADTDRGGAARGLAARRGVRSDGQRRANRSGRRSTRPSWRAISPATTCATSSRAGCSETSGNYKMLVELLNMEPTDYKRFLNFLRKHECHLPFERFQSAGLRRRASIDQDVTTPPSFDRTHPLSDGVREADKHLPATGTTRR